MTNERLKRWFGLCDYVKSRIEDTRLESIFNTKYDENKSYISASSDLYISEAGFYQKADEIYEIAMYYIAYYRLIEFENDSRHDGGDKLMPKSNKDLENELNTKESYTALNGDYNLTLSQVNSFFAGGIFIKNLVTINQGNKIVDGSDARITVEINEDAGSGLSVFNILKSVRGLTFRNISLSIKYTGNSSNATIYGIRNNSHNFIVKDCKIDFFAINQINYTAIFNDGGLDTHLETSADTLTIIGSHIMARCSASEISKNSELCGIRNELANSISISNNYIFVQNVGNGDKQKAFGIINSGRYARIENNNIKANGCHNIGLSLEQAHAYGVYNSGLYMVYIGNNCVAEWGGKCIGLYNIGAYANISGNKILATHTIMGRSIILSAENCVLNNNIITNTSRNPHFIEVLASANIITGNYMQGLLSESEYQSGCGILVQGQAGHPVKRCNISCNTISHARDFGIILQNTEGNILQGNQIIKLPETEDFIAVYAENSKDKVSENIFDGQLHINNRNCRDKLLRNYDEAVHSLISET